MASRASEYGTLRMAGVSVVVVIDNGGATISVKVLVVVWGGAVESAACTVKV